eukprot:TRINITY_DN72271_c0_g1_i1.p1 TRINITY_DN72271_c0_g1~~TRINITY_DN72271_c0_g1_i1.p1  ORF type:complete len:588 (+),score=128.67 TRINITY_DN72271_c0_g1_i1:110-1873(+)
MEAGAGDAAPAVPPRAAARTADERYGNCLQGALFVMLEAAAEAVGAERGTVYVPSAAQGAAAELVAAAIFDSGSRQRIPGNYHPSRVRCPATQGLCGSVYASGVAVNVVGKRPAHDSDDVSGRPRRDRSSLCFPLRSRTRKVLGVLHFANKDQGNAPFTAADCALAWSFARLIGSVLAKYPYDPSQDRFDPQVLHEGALPPARLPPAKGLNAILSQLPTERDLVCHTADPNSVDAMCRSDVARGGVPLLGEKQLMSRLRDFAEELANMREMWNQSAERATDLQTANEQLEKELREQRQELDAERRERMHLLQNLRAVDGQAAEQLAAGSTPAGRGTGSGRRAPHSPTRSPTLGERGRGQQRAPSASPLRALRQGLPLTANPLHLLHLAGDPPEAAHDDAAGDTGEVPRRDVAVQVCPTAAAVAGITAAARQRGGRISPLPSLPRTRAAASAAALGDSDGPGSSRTERNGTIVQEVRRLGKELARQRNRLATDLGVLGPLMQLESGGGARRGGAGVLDQWANNIRLSDGRSHKTHVLPSGVHDRLPLGWKKPPSEPNLLPALLRPTPSPELGGEFVPIAETLSTAQGP